MSLNDLLSARSAYLSAKLSYESSVYELLNSIINVIKAFGGGFDMNEDYEDSVLQSGKALDMSFRE